MKISKLLAVATLASASFATVASAATIRLTGSTAYRTAVNKAILNVFTNSGNPFTYAFSGATFPSGASQSIFHGNLGFGTVTVKTAFAGSMGGVFSVTKTPWPNALNVTYIADSVVGSAGGTSGASPTVAEPAHIAYSDVAQESTICNGAGFLDLTGSEVKTGVVVFKWLRTSVDGAATWAGDVNSIANLTNSGAQLILGGGLTGSYLTGAATTSTIYATGRDEDSGTRITAFAESAFGPQSTPVQYQATVSGGKITAIAPFAVPTTLNAAFGTSWGLGHSGEASGGTLAGKLFPVSAAVTRTSPAGVTAAKHLGLVTYAGLNDSATAILNGAAELSWNGVFYSDAGVKNGSYTFWGYEWSLERNDIGADQAAADSVFGLVSGEVSANTAILSGTDLGSMNVSRTKEGDIVTPL